MTNQDQLKNWLVRRFSLKGHMTCILMCTALSGVLFSTGLHSFGLNALIVRYPVSVVLSYGIFFLLVKIWLRIIFPSHEQSSGMRTSHIYSPNYWPIGGFGSGPSTTTNVPGFRGGGGRSGGGGASASWGAAAAMAPSPAQAASPASGGFLGLGDIKLPSGGKDSGGLIVLILGGLVITAVFGSAIYLIATSSQILAEAAFQFAMSAGLVRSAKRAVSGSWEGTVFRETYIPFILVLVLSLAFGAVARSNYPNATTLSDVLQAASQSTR